MEAPPISFVTPWYGRFAGGAEVAARTFAEQLARRGFGIEVLTTCCPSPFDNWWRNTLPAGVETIGGVRVRRFPVREGGEDRYHALNARIVQGEPLSIREQQTFVANTINSDALVEYVREQTAGRFVIGMPFTQGVVHEAVMAIAGRAALMPCLHDEPQAVWSTTAEMFAAARHLFFLSEEEKTVAIRLFGGKLGRRLVEAPVVGVGVELSETVQLLLHDADARAEVRTRYELPERFLVYVGRKDVGKNVRGLLSYYSQHRAEGGQEGLVFLGGGDASLVAGASGVRDLGFLPEADKHLILAEATALVNLSENESFSLVLMEAWLSGAPVVVSARAGVTSGHCLRSGGGVPVATGDDFISALALLRQPSTRDRMAEFGRRYVQRHYSWDAVLDRFVSRAA